MENFLNSNRLNKENIASFCKVADFSNEDNEDQSEQLFIYNPETQEIESYEFGPGKIGVNLDYGYVEPELRFWLNSETYKIKKYMNEVE